MNRAKHDFPRRLGAALLMLGLGAAAQGQQDQAGQPAHPDWSGQWSRIGGLEWPPAGYREAGPPPLTPEYQAIWEQHQASQEQGVPAGDPTARCLPPGMPRVMKMDQPMEILITPASTYIYGHWDSQFRRVFTDGRGWPDFILPTYNGYSIGEWQDEDGDGTYDLLSVETRALKGPRVFDHTAAPLHENNATVVHEEIRRVDDNTLENRITTIDDALTAPWTISQRYRHEAGRAEAVWDEHLCVQDKRHLKLGDNWYIFNPDGETLQPATPEQEELVPVEEQP